MIYDYLITLKKTDGRFVDQVSQLMYVFALFAFAYFYYHSPKNGAVYLYTGCGIIVSWIFTIITKRRKGAAFFRFGLLIGALGWFAAPQKNLWMAVLYVVAALLEKQVKFPQEIGFSEKEISFNTFPTKTLQWNQVNNALIKDGIITIDQKNNQLFQKEIEGDVTSSIEKEFNEFCLRCLNNPAAAL